MSESTLKPFTGKLDENTDIKQQPTLQPFTGALDGEKKSVMGHLKDTGLSALKGAIAVPESVVGIMDTMSDGAVGKTLENKDGTIGFRPNEAKQALSNLNTDQYKAQQQEFADAGKDGGMTDKIVEKTKVALKNPSLIANAVVESAPSIIASGAMGRATGIANPVVAGAVGEGLSMSGSQAEQIRQNTVDGNLTADQSLASVGTGALGSLFSLAGGRVAQKLGIGDANTLLAGGRAGAADIANEIASMPAKSVPRKVIEGALHEGLLEELPQSVSEQILQNLALSKPWSDGIEDAAVMGTLAGMAMGAAAGPMHGGHGHDSNSVEQGSSDQTQNSYIPQLGMRDQDQAIDGEYIPRQDMSSQDPQQRTTYTYDQQPTDAENLLGNNNSNFGAPDDLAGSNPSDIPPNGPNTPPAPNGNYFDGDYGSEAAFDDLLNAVPPASQTPSQQMGINPNDGPMSSAAALAVDSGASSVLQTGLAQEQQTQGQTIAPLSDAVPSDYRQLMEQNNGQSFGTGFENAALQQGNTQADNASKSSPQSDNASKSLPQQNDTHTAKAMAGQTETNGAATAQAKTVQPILGADGQNKWFGSQEKAQAFIDKKNLGNDYQVVRDGKRFEIQPKKLQSTSQNVDTLPKTESSNQDDVPNPYNENKLRAQVRDLNLQASKEAQANNAKDSNYIANLGNTASARSNEKVKQQLPDLYKRAEELAKTAEITSAGRRGNTHFSSLSFKGDSSFVSGDAWPKRPTKDEILQQAIWHLSQDDKNGTPKNVQSALQLTELEKQFKNEKSAAKKAQIRKQITELQNGLTEQVQSTVSLNQPQKTTVENLSGEFKKIEESTTRINAVRQRIREANPEIFTAENDRVRETHGLTNARVTMMADEIETSGSYELSDREYEKIKNNPNYKIDYDARNFMGKVTAVKDPHSGEWVGNNEQTATDSKKVSSDQQKDIEQFITENKSAFPNNWQRDSQWSAQARAAVEKKLDEILPGDISQKEFQTQVDQAMEFAKKQYPTLEQQHKQNKHPVNKWQEEMNKALEKADPEHPLFKKLQASAKNGLKSVSDRAVALRQAREIEKKAEAPKAQADTPKTKPEQPKSKVEPSKNTLVSDDRAAELRARLKAKLSQLNSGIDPEIMAIGAELAVYHIERGARKFAALAKNIANDLDVSVEKIRPYLRSWYNGARDMMEDMGADIQGMDNAETVRAELEKLDNPQQQSNAVQGKTETVVTPSGREFEVQHKVVEADDLITSNLDSGAVNAEYPQALQPRDRTTLKSVTQINDIANKLNPKLLGDSASSTNGAPIVSSDNEVESGNGRTLAIRKAYQTGKAGAYKAWLAEQGYNVANMQQPILVRERITPMNMAERVAYTTESNERDTLDMSPSEQAMSDAPKVMDILHLVQGGSFNNTANRDFVNAFLTGVASKNERGTMLDRDGVSLTQDGYRRIESALLAAAFNDAQIISQVIESKDSDIKAIGNALIEAAPQWAQVRKGVQEGILVEGVNVEANLVEAVHLVRKARQQNLSLSEMLNQDDIFDGSIDQVTKDFIGIFYSGDKLNKARSSQKVADALKSYAQLAMTAKATPNLFGDAPLSNEQILGQVHEKLRQSEAEKQQDIFTSPQSNEPDAGTVGGGRSGRGTGPRSETAQEQSEPTKALKKTAPTSEKETIQDFGEKIGGARKDTSVKTGPKTSGTTTKDNRPTWAKRFEITEIAASSNPNEVGKWIITDTRKKDWKGNAKQLGKQFFDSQKDAELALPILAVAQKHRVWAAGKDSFSIYREISDRKRVKVVEQEFQTREDAMKYMAIHAIEILETNTTFGEIDLPRPENTVRKGLDRRKGDAKDADFIRVFGFSGVEFGNWNNQAERQELLNDAFDGLMDLAEILNIPPAAISLNGELALAFGARGQGLSGAKAHYEPERAVINLTKLNGAGSLAHEWWHALDHYFGRQDGKAPSEWVTNADGSRSLKIAKHFEDMSVTSGFSYKSNVREDVQEAYKQLVQTIFRKSENYIDDTVKVESFVSSARNNLKDQLDKLRADLNRELDPKYYKRFNKAASAEQLAEFDTVAELLLTGTALTTEIRHNNNKNSRNIFSGARWSNDALDKLSVIYKSVRGRSGFNAEQKGVLDRLRQYMNTYAQRLKLLAEAQNGTEKAKMIPTDFAMNAKELDQGRGTDYWITTPEMTARAFQGYVEDKISQNSGYSPFLNFGPESAAIFTPWGFKRPFPTGTERKAINAKFSDLVDTLKTEETETGIKLYSRDKLKPDNERRGASPLDTTFTPLSVVSATRRVLSVLQHLKIVTAQIDASVRGRIVVGGQRVGVNKVKGLDSHSFMVQVVESFDGLPSAIQEDNRYQGENGETKRYDVLGVWHNGTLYINAGDIQGNNSTQQTTFEMYEELILHEVVGHFGVQQIFGREYKTKLQQLFNALGGLEGIRKIAKDNGVDMQQFNDVYINPRMQAVKDEIYTESDVQQSLVGELFAFVAQNAKSRPFVRQKLKEVIGYIRQWFRDRGFDKFLSRYNDADLMMFLSEARKAVVDRSYFGKYKNQEISSKNNSDTPLYSRRTKSNSGSTTQQVRDVLIDRFGKETIDELERQGKLEIIQDYQVEGVEGFYYNGKAVLVASNLTAESTVPTFLHELGGHAGFQNMMNQKQYNELMNQFNKLVEQGNPVAMAAKLLAEREQGSERQHLEYLPYLLTLSSTMQQRNVVQRNALQKLINNLVTYVKATLFDNFGINLNLNPNDIVALAERMIEKSSYNAENATSPLYSRQSMQDTIDKLSQNLKSLTIKSIKDKSGDKKIDWLGIGLSALGRRQLTEIYAKLLPQLNKYNELAAQMDADKNDAGAEADSIVREWGNLNDEEALANVMHDSTLAKIDPTKPYVSGDSISKYKQLRDAYNSLSPEAQAMYLKARDAYKKHYAEVHQAIKERILRSELSNQKKADLLKQMDDNFFGSIKGVYFPLARFGKYVVVMRNQNGEVESVSRAETMGEAQALRSELIQKFPHYKVNKVKLDKEYNKSRDAVGRGFMTSLFAEVDNLGLSTAERTEFEDTLSQLYLSSMPDLSWAKHGIHRKGTAGFSKDARRAFAQNMFSGANYLAKLRYGDQLAQQLDEMQKYADEQFEVDEDYDQRSAQSVITEMNKRHDNLMNPKGHPLSSALTSLGFIYYLGLSPAAAMVNLSQTALMAYPLMGAKWDFDKAGKELLKASNDFRKGLKFHKVKWQGTKTDLYKAVSSDISKFLNKDEQAAYQKAVDSGVIDVTQAHDLAGIAQGEDSGIMWKTRPIMRAASVMFHSAERFNREVTFIASYRLARQAGANHDDAYEQADKMTYDSHYDYGSGNRPRIMQGNVAKVLLLFKQFGQNMVYTLARQTYQSIKGETKEERREARRAISAILAMHATFAGALGLPMVGMLLSVASWMGGDDDDPWDAEVALRNYLAEAFGPTISNMLMKGAPRGIGVDISGRVGINNLLLPDVQEGLEGKKWWDSASAAVLGPIGGIGANIAKGAQEISEGHNLRGVESMLPVFLKNFAKTYRYADEGVQDKTGVSIMDEVSSMDLLVQGMGFSPSDVRTASEGKTAIYQLNRKLNERRSRLMALWSRAKMMDDQQEMDEIWEEIQGFNDKNPSRRITRMNLNQSYRNRQRRIDRAEDGIYLSRNRQDAREAGYFAFGE